MKKAAIIILVIVAVAVMSAFSVGSVAMASETMWELSKVTYLDAEMTKDYDISLGYKRGITLEVSSSYPQYKIEILQNLGNGYIEFKEFPISETKDKLISYTFVDSGDFKIIIFAMSDNQIMDNISYEVKSDTEQPIAPYIDYKDLETYNLYQFNLKYVVYKDSKSGIDFSKSVYYMKKNGDFVIARTALGEHYGDNYISISDNGIITFEVYDMAGNFIEVEYLYNKFGMPEAVIPVFSSDVPLDKYANKATISISWGTENDNNPFVIKEYSIISGSGSSPVSKYTQPLVITQEGNVEIVAYYIRDGERRKVSYIVKNVDKTPPNASSITETISLNIDLASTEPIKLMLRVSDALSGIDRVMLANEESHVFHSMPNHYYYLNLDRKAVTIRVIDKAGNYIDYNYVTSLDIRLCKELSKLILDMDRSQYAPSALDRLENSIKELSIMLIAVNPSTSDVDKLVKQIKDIIEGRISTDVKIQTVPPGINCAMTLNIDANDIQETLLKSDKVILIINQTQQKQDNLETNNSFVHKLSGFLRSNVFNFHLNLVNSNNISINLANTATITVPLPTNFTGYTAKIYKLLDGILYDVTSANTETAVIVTTQTFGEFFLVIENTITNTQDFNNGVIIGGRFYSYLMLGITGGIFVVVIMVSTIVLIKIAKKSVKHKK